MELGCFIPVFTQPRAPYLLSYSWLQCLLLFVIAIPKPYLSLFKFFLCRDTIKQLCSDDSIHYQHLQVILSHCFSVCIFNFFVISLQGVDTRTL